MKLVQAGKFGVGVYNIDGALYAIANYCSHEGAPLCAGYVGGTNEFAPDMPGQLRRVREGRIARCPWHQWEFDITTGVNLADAQKRVRTYEVDVMDGQVYLTA
jgi:nitrite reductase/ring-hydroxylating ferredoxin subunit